MGYIVNVSADTRGKDPVELQSYIKALVEDATGEPVVQVVFHDANKNQSPEQQLDQLRAMRA